MSEETDDGSDYKSQLTAAELTKLETCNLSRDNPFAIQGVMHSQLSVARFYGGLKYNGDHYVYFPATDELVREDVLKFLRSRPKRAKKSTKKAKPPEDTGNRWAIDPSESFIDKGY